MRNMLRRGVSAVGFYMVLAIFAVVAIAFLGILSIGPIFWIFCLVGGAFSGFPVWLPDNKMNYQTPVVVLAILMVGKGLALFFWPLPSLLHIVDAVIGLLVFMWAWWKFGHD